MSILNGLESLNPNVNCNPEGIGKIYLMKRDSVMEIPFTLSSEEGSFKVHYYEISTEDNRQFKVIFKLGDDDLSKLFPEYAIGKYWRSNFWNRCKYIHNEFKRSKKSRKYKNKERIRLCKTYGISLSDVNQFKYKKCTNFIERLNCANLRINEHPVISISIELNEVTITTNVSPSFGDNIRIGNSLVWLVDDFNL